MTCRAALKTGALRRQVCLVLRQPLAHGGQGGQPSWCLFSVGAFLRCDDGCFDFRHLLISILHQGIVRRILLQELRTLGFGGPEDGRQDSAAARLALFGVLLRSRLRRIHFHLLLVNPDLFLAGSNRVL